MTIDAATLVGLDAEGKSARQIAAVMGCSIRTVVRWRAELGLSHECSPHAGRSPSQERLDAARALLEDGASHREVERTLGMTGQTLTKYFPGTQWTFQQAGTLARMTRDFNRLERISVRAIELERSA